MADALTSLQSGMGAGRFRLHQALHGYAEGHRLLESSFPIPDDLKRLMLRMSDLSGTSVANGFQDYLTGYPLASLNAYALAKTWYAPEMSRPGCVWTQSFIIPAAVMAQMTTLSPIRLLFKRPKGRSISEAYSKPVLLESESFSRGQESDLEQRMTMQAFIAAHYQKDLCPLIIPALNSDQYADLIFAAWSQKWLALRMSFTFSTGSLSARTIENHALDVQCVPISATRQVGREIAEAGFGKPIILDHAPRDLPRWTMIAANDAVHHEKGPVRSFLWSIADNKSGRADFEPFMKIYDALNTSISFANILTLTADAFPQSVDGLQLKRALFESDRVTSTLHIDPKDSLFSLATTESYQSFDIDLLNIREQASRLITEQRTIGRLLLESLFRASLNPIGEEILKSLILAMQPADALAFASDQPQFISALFRVNAALATSAQLWRCASGRSRELFDSLVIQTSIAPEVIRRIVEALLDSGSDAFIGRALEQWETIAVLAVLNWIDVHGGHITENCRIALKFYVSDVMNWITTRPEKSTSTIAAIAHIVAPSSGQIAKYNSSVWLHAFHKLQGGHHDEEADYMSAFLLTLALLNAPPDPLELLVVSFERVYRLAEKEKLKDDAWFILQPFVPELSWRKNWDKCERMRRALVSAFMLYNWPAWQIKNVIKSYDIFEQLPSSARKVGAEYYFDHCW